MRWKEFSFGVVRALGFNPTLRYRVVVPTSNEKGFISLSCSSRETLYAEQLGMEGFVVALGQLASLTPLSDSVALTSPTQRQMYAWFRAAAPRIDGQRETPIYLWTYPKLKSPEIMAEFRRPR